MVSTLLSASAPSSHEPILVMQCSMVVEVVAVAVSVLSVIP